MDAVAQHFQGHGRLPVLGENNGTNPGARQRPGVNPSVAWLPGDGIRPGRTPVVAAAGA